MFTVTGLDADGEFTAGWDGTSLTGPEWLLADAKAVGTMLLTPTGPEVPVESEEGAWLYLLTQGTVLASGLPPVADPLPSLPADCVA